jgi:DNA-binding NarL/FixJ family response regulator
VRTSPRLRKSFFVPEFREFERREKHRRNFGLTPNENPADRRSAPSEEDVSMMRPRVLLADDHTLLLEAFQRLLADECEVVGMVSDGRALLAAADKLRPDIVVVDVAMPLLNGLDATRQLKQVLPETRIVFLTMNEDPDLAAEAFRAGASGYLLKRSAASELLTAIREVMRHRSYVTPLITSDLVGSMLRGADASRSRQHLTTRQREVVQLLAEGHSMKEVAAILNIAPRTVAFHKYRIMEQLNMKTTADLIQFAIKHHIV